MGTRNKKRKLPEPPAEAFLNMARQYHIAANTLFSVARDNASPVYFLYTHTIEFALKAYLRSLGCSVPRGPQGHDLHFFLQECRAKGLRTTRDLAHVIRLLLSEDKGYGFRYFDPAESATTAVPPSERTSIGIPEISYLRQVVDDLMLTVTEKVEQTPSDASAGGAVLKFVVGKPVSKRPNNTQNLSALGGPGPLP